MKFIGFLLLLSGWGIVLAAVLMLHGRPTLAFIALGVAVEILGIVFVARAHLRETGENE
jgi:heme/copper-type cytochrome/quinol oxidase subunit 3